MKEQAVTIRRSKKDEASYGNMLYLGKVGDWPNLGQSPSIPQKEDIILVYIGYHSILK